MKKSIDFPQIAIYQVLKKEFIDAMISSPELVYIAMNGSLQETIDALDLLLDKSEIDHTKP
jgi:hypothetical protein